MNYDCDNIFMYFTKIHYYYNSINKSLTKYIVLHCLIEHELLQLKKIIM